MSSITEAQVKLLQSNYLNKLGSLRGDFDTPVLNDILTQYATAFLEQVVTNINKAGITYKGSLSTELTFSTTKTQAGYEVDMGYPVRSKSAKYYDFQNKGVAGVGKRIASPYSFKTLAVGEKMQASIAEWLKSSGKSARLEDQKKGLSKLQKKRKAIFKSTQSNAGNSLAYIVARSIKRKGIKQTLYFDKAITKVFDKNFIKLASQALGADIKINIIKDSYGNNN